SARCCNFYSLGKTFPATLPAGGNAGCPAERNEEHRVYTAVPFPRCQGFGRKAGDRAVFHLGAVTQVLTNPAEELAGAPQLIGFVAGELRDDLTDFGAEHNVRRSLGHELAEK